MSKTRKKHKNRSKRNTQIDETTVKTSKTSTLSDVHKTLNEILDEIRWFRMCAMFGSKDADFINADFDALFAENNLENVDKNEVEEINEDNSQQHKNPQDTEQLEIPNITEIKDTD